MSEARIHAIMGSSGGGKTTHLVKLLTKRKRNRTLIWSPKEAKDNYMGLYPGSVLCTTSTEVHQILVSAGPKGPFHIVFQPRLVRKEDEKHFHVVCKMALARGNLAFVVDELHTITRPTWAPDGWSELVMMGRAFDVEIFGLSQRPASMDKDFLGNCSTVHTRRLSLPDDAATVAKSIGAKPAEVSALSGYQWMERDTLTGKVTRG
jgi:hypothetical protein